MNKIKLLQLAKLVAKFSEIATDKGTLITDGELVEGVEVFIEVDGELNKADDGEYKLENEDVVVVADGKVSEIRKAEPEEKKSEEEPATEELDVKATAKDKFNAIKIQFEVSYQEIQQNIYSALADANVYGYILENGNDYAIVSVFSDEDEREHLFRYEISIDENGFVTLGDRKEVRVEYVPVDEPKEEEQPEAKEEAKEETTEEQFKENTPVFKQQEMNETSAKVSLAEVVRKMKNNR